jgi:hypothetical protein
MLNIIDLVIAGLILFYLLRNAGGLLKTVKNLLVVVASLVILVILARLLLDSALISGEARKMLDNSYFVAISANLVKSVYPTVEDNAPKLNSFIKEKILTAPTPEVTVPKIKTTLPGDLPTKLDSLLQTKSGQKK